MEEARGVATKVWNLLSREDSHWTGLAQRGSDFRPDEASARRMELFAGLRTDPDHFSLRRLKELAEGGERDLLDIHNFGKRDLAFVKKVAALDFDT